MRERVNLDAVDRSAAEMNRALASADSALLVRLFAADVRLSGEDSDEVVGRNAVVGYLLGRGAESTTTAMFFLERRQSCDDRVSDRGRLQLADARIRHYAIEWTTGSGEPTVAALAVRRFGAAELLPRPNCTSTASERAFDARRISVTASAAFGTDWASSVREQTSNGGFGAVASAGGCPSAICGSGGSRTRVYPHQVSDPVAYGVSVRYRATNRLGAEIAVQLESPATVRGLQLTDTTASGHHWVDHEMGRGFIASAQLQLDGRRVHLGAGPAIWHSSWSGERWDLGVAGSTTASESWNRIGLVSDAALSLPLMTRAFLDARVRLQFFGKARTPEFRDFPEMSLSPPRAIALIGVGSKF